MRSHRAHLGGCRHTGDVSYHNVFTRSLVEDGAVDVPVGAETVQTTQLTKTSASQSTLEHNVGEV